MGDMLAGYLGAVFACLFFGSAYVPAKKYPTYDGIIFQWFMCSGILLVGLLWGLLSTDWSKYANQGLYIFPGGIVGGASFAMANLLIPTVVNNLGLGVGFMVWNGTNMMLGYAISRYGYFGITPTIPHNEFGSQIGIACMLASVVVFGLIRPTLRTTIRETPHSSALYTPGYTPMEDGHNATVRKKKQKQSEQSPLIHYSHDDHDSESPRRDNYLIRNGQLHLSSSTESLSEIFLHPELPNYGPYMMAANVSQHVELDDTSAEKKRKFVGICLAALVGAFLSYCLVPYVQWQQSCVPMTDSQEDVNNRKVSISCNPLNFAFAQCLGIYLTSTIVFLLYSALHRFVLKRSMPRSVMRPAYMSGILWCFGLGGQLYSAGQIGFDQAYPVTAIGPPMVSMLWSALYFGEIEGKRNFQILAVACILVVLGTTLRVVNA